MMADEFNYSMNYMMSHNNTSFNQTWLYYMSGQGGNFSALDVCSIQDNILVKVAVSVQNQIYLLALLMAVEVILELLSGSYAAYYRNKPEIEKKYWAQLARFLSGPIFLGRLMLVTSLFQTIWIMTHLHP